jgi:membrane fusion protein, heavy metal efflux system
LSLNGIVIADPNGSGVVQSQIGGRVSGQLPTLGERVGRGQGMARITPAFDPSGQAALVADQGQVAQDLALARDRAARLAGGAGTSEVDAELAAARARASGGATAEARVQVDAARDRLARLERLNGVVPQRDVDAARAELRGAQARVAALQAEANATVQALQTRRATLVSQAQAEANALSARKSALSKVSTPGEVARAPVSGIVSAVEVAQGQVVSAGQTLFSIVDPSRLLVEAQATGESAAYTGDTATGRTADGRTITLVRQGAGLALVNGAALVRYRVELSDGLRVGEAVKVFARSTLPASGIAIPRVALSRAANGQTVVFVKDSAERFTPVPVTTTDFDANNVLVTAGLSAGARVVTAGANLLAQVR